MFFGEQTFFGVSFKTKIQADSALQHGTGLVMPNYNTLLLISPAGQKITGVTTHRNDESSLRGFSQECGRLEGK